MTRLTFLKDGIHYVGFSCKGHSGYACEGEDIVCASISTAVELVVAYLLKFHGNSVCINVNEQNALIEIKCNEVFDEADRQIAILEDFSISLSEQYSDYFTFDYLEV